MQYLGYCVWAKSVTVGGSIAGERLCVRVAITWGILCGRKVIMRYRQGIAHSGHVLKVWVPTKHG